MARCQAEIQASWLSNSLPPATSQGYLPRIHARRSQVPFQKSLAQLAPCGRTVTPDSDLGKMQDLPNLQGGHLLQISENKDDPLLTREAVQFREEPACQVGVLKT